MIEFVLTSPDLLPPKALKWSQRSLNNTPGNTTTLSDILEHARLGEGQFYLVKSDQLIGSIFLEWTSGCLNMVLVSGDDIKAWRDELHDFCVSLMRQRGVKTIMFMGRYGLGKVFPQFKSLGMVFVYEDK